MTVTQRADMPTWECYDLVGAGSVGRLCFLDGDTPIAFPVSFKLHRAADASYIVVRTGPTSLISKYAGPASFEVDDIDVRRVRRGASYSRIAPCEPRKYQLRCRSMDRRWSHTWQLLRSPQWRRRFVARDSTDGSRGMAVRRDGPRSPDLGRR